MFVLTVVERVKIESGWSSIRSGAAVSCDASAGAPVSPESTLEPRASQGGYSVVPDLWTRK